MRVNEKPKHRSIMLNILRKIYTDRYLGINLGFKGGTACYFFYDLPRFSVDLDFNLIDPRPQKAKKVFSELKNILEEYGEIIDENQKYNTILLELNYESGFRNLKVEVSTRNDKDGYQLLDLYGVTCKVMKKEYMFARKLIALTNRKKLAARDLFDIHYFLSKGWQINQKVVENATGKVFSEYIVDVVQFIKENFHSKNVLNGVGELLNEDQRKDPELKSKLIEETVFNLKILRPK